MGRRESPRRKEVRSFRCGGLAGGDIRPRPAEVSCGWQTVSRSSCTPLPGFPNCRSICAHRAGWREARSSRPTRRVEFAPRAWEIDAAGNGRRNLECNAENNKHDGAPDWDCQGDLRGRGRMAGSIRAWPGSTLACRVWVCSGQLRGIVSLAGREGLPRMIAQATPATMEGRRGQPVLEQGEAARCTPPEVRGRIAHTSRAITQEHPLGSVGCGRKTGRKIMTALMGLESW